MDDATAMQDANEVTCCAFLVTKNSTCVILIIFVQAYTSVLCARRPPYLLCFSDHFTIVQAEQWVRCVRVVLITFPKEFSSLFVCLSVSNFAQNIRTDLHEIFMKGSQWANEQVIKFQWRFESPFGYKDCFPDSTLLGDTESG